VPAVFRFAIDGLRGLGTCILVGSARAGTESAEMPWLQGGRILRDVIQGPLALATSPAIAAPKAIPAC
jgi:hypothetical protein